MNHKKKYDLIWIDSAHGYPVVCIDIINSLHLINEKGIIMAKELLKILKKSPKDSSGKNSTALQNKITRLSIEILGISDIMEE